ncbi:TCP-1_chaperonin subunit beta [Hexamita inflata]
MKQGAVQEKGEEARLTSLVGAVSVSDMVKTTLGPAGMDKILQSVQGGMRITNDGATILKSVMIDNPAARVLIDISRVQDEAVGDGTTSVCVLAGELLRSARELLDKKVHPMSIVEGYRTATDIARKALEKNAHDNSADKAQFREDLLKIARTTMSSKILPSAQELFANLAVDAVLRLEGDPNLNHIQIIKKAGSTLSDSYLDDGFILNKKIGAGQPKRIENPVILLANTALDQDKIKIEGGRVKVHSHAQMEEIEQAERARMEAKCQKIVDHKINVFINRQLVYDVPQQYFAKNNVVCIEHADFEGVERLSLILKADIVSTFDHPDDVKLGTCKLIEEIMIGEDTLLKFSGLPSSRASTIVLRGASGHILEEAERSLHDALCVVSQTVINSKVVLGAGNAETLMANAVELETQKIQGKQALVMQAFANALRQIPVTLADNGGFDGDDLAAQLRGKMFNGDKDCGLDMRSGSIGNVREMGVFESYKCKEHVLMYAAEAAEQILRVDSIVNCAPRQRQ